MYLLVDTVDIFTIVAIVNLALFIDNVNIRDYIYLSALLSSSGIQTGKATDPLFIDGQRDMV